MNVNIISLVQGTTPSEIRGRILSVLSTLVLALIPLSQGFPGILIDAIDQQIPLLFISIGCVFTAIVMLSSFSKDLRMYLSTDYENA